MSTAPVDRATLPSVMGDGVTRPGRAFRLFGEMSGQIVVELGHVPRYVVRYSVAVLALLGLFSLWDAHGDSHVPAMVPLMGTEKDPHLHSGLSCAEPGVRDRERWHALSAPLAILDDVNPQVAGWERKSTIAADWSSRIGTPAGMADKDRWQTTITSAASSPYSVHSSRRTTERLP